VVIGRKSGLRRVCINLQRVGEELVHLGDAGGDAEVDGAVANLDDESADDVGVDLTMSDGERFDSGWYVARTSLVTLSFLP
jgi:hypothetical protein